MSSTPSEAGSRASDVSDGSVSSQQATDINTRSPLWRSLYVLCTTAVAVSENTLTSVPTANNPRPLRSMGDNAEYWVNDSGEPFTCKFPATLDLDGQFDRSGPYFNLPRTGLDLGALKKMRAQFEVRPLDIEGIDKYPEEAIKCSSAAMDMFNVLHGEAEEARNALLPTSAVYPRDAPFWRRYPDAENERFSVVLTTDPLVQNIPDPSRSSVPRLRRSDIGKGDTMHSPSKARAAAMAGGPPGGGGGAASSGTNGEHMLSDLPDPLGRYAGLIAQYNLRNCVVVAPPIRDGHGILIRPHEYATRLATGDVVMVECFLKLWTIAPNKRDNAPQDDRNGSRRYQVMLKSMRLLPDASISADTMLNGVNDQNGKRKACDDGGNSRSRKRPSNGYNSGEEDGDNNGEGGSTNLYAMQITKD